MGAGPDYRSLAPRRACLIKLISIGPSYPPRYTFTRGCDRARRPAAAILIRYWYAALDNNVGDAPGDRGCPFERSHAYRNATARSRASGRYASRLEISTICPAGIGTRLTCRALNRRFVFRLQSARVSRLLRTRFWAILAHGRLAEAAPITPSEEAF